MAEETINEAVLKELEAAAKEATSGVLYAHKIRSTAGVVSYDLGTNKHFDPDGDGESIAEVYHEWDATYFVKANPRVVLALIAELETVRAERDALRAKLAEIMETAMWGTIGDYDPTLLDIEIMAADALNTQPPPQAEWTPRFVVGETVRVDRFIDDAFAGWLGEIEQIKRVGDTYEYYLVADNHPGFARYPFGWFAEKLIDGDDNVPDWVEGMDKEAD